MARCIRPRIGGATIFFTVYLAERGASLLTDEIGALRAAVRQTRAERPFAIKAWGVLPDHLHAVRTLPEGDTDYGQRWGAIKARFTRSLRDRCRVGFHPTLARANRHADGWNPTLHRSASKVAKGDSGIWQRRFWEHHIRNAADYHAHLRHCREDPVKHGLVKRPEEWLYSSLHRDVRRDGAQVLTG